MASGGNMTPYRRAARVPVGIRRTAGGGGEAHAAGLPLAVHAHGAQAIADALALGADSIEHCTLFSADGVDADPDVLQQLATGGCVI